MLTEVNVYNHDFLPNQSYYCGSALYTMKHAGGSYPTYLINSTFQNRDTTRECNGAASYLEGASISYHQQTLGIVQGGSLPSIVNGNSTIIPSADVAIENYPDPFGWARAYFTP